MFALSACSGPGETGPESSAPAEPSPAERIEALADCVPDDLVALLPWTGPAVDPSTGALTAPLPAGHVEAVVNGWRRYGDEADALRLQHGEATLIDVLGRDGLLAFESVESERCPIAISHTLWRDEASMRAFVTGEAHVAAMADANRMHELSLGAHWTGEAREALPSWQEGIARYVDEVRAKLR